MLFFISIFLVCSLIVTSCVLIIVPQIWWIVWLDILRFSPLTAPLGIIASLLIPGMCILGACLFRPIQHKKRKFTRQLLSSPPENKNTKQTRQFRVLFILSVVGIITGILASLVIAGLFLSGHFMSK